ncbi:hypothetical protein CPB84DRAFT_1788106 [Gymnopilus junonius]|uniref:Secreted protein n=1 Tax=Gymnopilus junonius TaxID=109634 RepID=A0A9P5NHR0_GYMJU|nr:hypothetical protein CPB84DRAFT_1788106 [Gymnopilus junonius]
MRARTLTALVFRSYLFLFMPIRSPLAVHLQSQSLSFTMLLINDLQLYSSLFPNIARSWFRGAVHAGMLITSLQIALRV